MRSFLIFLICFLLCGCQPDSPTATGPANTTEIHVKNESNQALVVYLVSQSGRYPVSKLVPQGGELSLRGLWGGYSWFSSPSKELDCVTIFDEAGEVVVFQQHPVDDTTWNCFQVASRVMYCEFVVSDNLLNLEGIEDNCDE